MVLRALLDRALLLPAKLLGLWRRLESWFYGLVPGRVCRPGAVTVTIGGMGRECRGRVLLSAWLLGWAKAGRLTAVVCAPPGDGHPAVRPLQVVPETDPAASGTEAGLLTRYLPEGRILIDTAPGRAARTAERTFAPDLLLVHGMLGDPRLASDIALALLTPDDLGHGFDRLVPAGMWQRNASTLRRASAFCVFAGPQALQAAMTAAEQRLQTYGKPVFGLTFRLWRWRGTDGTAAIEALSGEAYIAVLAESDRELMPELFRELLGVPPRLVFFVHDRHRFTRQDFENLLADATRMRVKTILTTPRLELKMRQGAELLDDLSVWTYDPEVVFGPTLWCDTSFLSWFEDAFVAAYRARHRA